MNWIIGSLLIAIVLYLLILNSRKKRLGALKKEIIGNWAKPKNESYHNFDLIAAYFNNKSHVTPPYHIIDGRTFIDLDLQEIFKFIDRTSSNVGQQYLYFKLRTIESQEKLNRFDQLVTIFKDNPELRVNCQLELRKLNSYNSYYLQELFNNKKPEKPKYLVLLYGLSATAVFSIFLTFYHPAFILLLLPIFIINMAFHYRNKENVLSYLNGIGQLSIALNVSKQLSSFKEINSFYKNFSFLKGIKRIKRRTRYLGLDKKLENDYAAVAWFFSELIKIMFNIEYILFHGFLKIIEQKRSSIEKMFVFIGEIDCAISCASVKAGERQTCTPTFIKEKSIFAKSVHHPLIEDCIENDLELNNSSLLLTGSNMSGKTTFIRTIGINSILSQTLNFCFATVYTSPYLKIYSSIGITDDLISGKSYYLQEVLRIKTLINATKEKEPCLFILDELFKGTNTVERISAGRGVLSYLNGKNSFVLVSTHDIELTELLKEEQYELYHFSELVKENELFFDHKLKPGKLKTRNAIKILEIYNYPTSIIEDAKATEEHFVQSNTRKRHD